jgi:hypothetical protein
VGVVWCGVVWCGVVWCGVVWCGVWVVWCGVVCGWANVILLVLCIIGYWLDAHLNSSFLLFVVTFPHSSCHVPSFPPTPQCIVVTTDQWTRTARPIITHWFPWIDFQDYTIVRTTLLVGDEREKAKYLPPHLINVLLEVNQCDTQLYQKIQVLQEKQLQLLSSRAFDAYDI